MDDYEIVDENIIKKSNRRRKKIVLIVVLVILVLLVVAVAAIAATSIEPEITYEDVKGEVIKADTISALCPEGWNLVDKSKGHLSFAKGGCSLHEYPHVEITYNCTREQIDACRENYENRHDRYDRSYFFARWKECKINDRVWQGFIYPEKYKQVPIREDYYQVIMLMPDDYKVSVVVVNNTIFKENIFYADHELKAILASIKVG